MAAGLWLASDAASAARYHYFRPHSGSLRHPESPPIPHAVSWPLEIEGSQYTPVTFADIAGWNDDDQLPAFAAFRTSCIPIAAQQGPPVDANSANTKALGTSLRDPCRAAKLATISDSAAARAFFERNFQPLRISRLGESDGFVTGD
jgi:membrane-bound lytic murein transglycosylase A